MQNKKINRIIMGVFILVIVFGGILYFIFNYTKDDSSLSIVEKKWINDNTNTIVDVNVYNDIPIYGYNGSGICFDFLDAFTEEYNINFNKISYYSNDLTDYKDISFKILENDQKVSDNDILFYEDNYVVVSKNELNLVDFDSINNVGVLSVDKELIINYLDKDITYKSYDVIDEAVLGMNSGEVDYLIIPNIMYMRQILNNDLKIVSHIMDLSQKYVLNVKNETIYNIMKKYYYKYLETNYNDDYSKEFLNSYFISAKIDDVNVKNYNAKIYKYGYVVNMPYENYTSSNFVGTISNYLSNFEKVANVEIEVVRYDSIDDLKNGLVKGEVDFALTNFDSSSLNMKNVTTQAFFDEYYVVLSRNNISLTSLKGLNGYEVSVIGSSNIHSLCLKNNIKTKVFNDTNDLIRNVNVDDIVVMDKYTYYYYKDEKLSNYKIVYEDQIDDAYKFIINESDGTFADLFDYYISSTSYMKIRYNYNTDIMLKDNNNSFMVVVLIIVLIIGSVFGLSMFNKRGNKGVKISKDDKMKYIDPMTSLKNRNYLNHNIYTWDDNVIFPQSVIILDVNDLQSINDKFGREVGDEIIKRVASILINNQLENTDIIRSGGDEFLIYMIGYDEKKVVEYARKMVKKMKDIPDSKGVEMGYSMIFDEVKTVDDAINEAIIMMKKNKDKNKSN